MRQKLILGAACVLILSGCGIELPGYHLSEYTQGELLGTTATEPDQKIQVPQAIRDKIDDILWNNFSPPWFWDEETLGQSQQAASVHAGAELFRRHCIHCHGLEGGGDGPTSPFLYPRPRDYRRGLFKWKSTERLAKPTREDLMEIVKNGAIGTSMPPFVLLPEDDLESIVDYVIYLSKRGELERRLLLFLATEAPPADQLESDEAAMNETISLLDEISAEALAAIDQQWADAASQVIAPEEPMPKYEIGSAAYKDSLARGKELYLSEKASCYKCHSRDGLAKDIAPSEAPKMIDDWGNPNFPRNLTLGLFRGGRRPVDIYRRIHQGIAGAAMPEGGRNLKPNEIWDLVNFVRALPYQPELLQGTQSEASQAGGPGH